MSKDIGRLIVCGNLVAPASEVEPTGTTEPFIQITFDFTSITSPATSSNKPLNSASLQHLAMPVAAADGYLARLCIALPVDVVPGVRDPATFALPQVSCFDQI